MPSNRGIMIAPMTVGDILLSTTTVTVGANVLGQILFATPTVEKLFGWTANELVGKNITILMPERLRAMHKIGFDKWVETKTLSMAEKELRINGLHKDGREVPVSLTIGQYFDGPDQRAVATIKDVKNIVELEESTELIRRELQYTKAITDNIGIGIITTDVNGIMLSVNPMAEKLILYTSEEMIGFGCHELLHKFNPDGSIERYEDCQIMKVMKSTEPKMVLDDYFKRKDGTFLNIDATVAPMIREGKNTGVVISFEDISNRKERELALKESEERYKMLVELSPDPIMVYSSGVFVFANAAALKLVGVTELSDIVGKPVLDFIHPDYRPMVTERMVEVLRTGKALPLLHEKALRIDGSPVDIEVTSMPILYNGTSSALAVIRDISERVMQDKRYQLITESSSDMIAMSTMDGKIIFANHPAHYIILGYDKGELEGVTLRSITHPSDLSPPEQEAIILENLKSGEKLPTTKVRLKHKLGHWVWVEGVGALITQGNNLTHFIYTARDITEKMEEERQLQQFFDTIPQMVWTAHPNGDIYWYNQNWFAYTGQKNGDALDWGWETVHHPDHIERVKREWIHSIETGKPFELQFPLKRYDGVYKWFLTRVNPVKENNIVVRWIGTNTDVDDNRKAYELKSRLASIIESSHSAIIGKTLHSTVTDWNPGAERLYGYTAKEAIDKNISFIVPDDKLDELEEIMKHLRSGEKVVDLITNRKRKDGSIVIVNIISSPVFDIDGVIIGASTVATSIEPSIDTDTPLESRTIVAEIEKERGNEL